MDKMFAVSLGVVNLQPIFKNPLNTYSNLNYYNRIGTTINVGLGFNERNKNISNFYLNYSFFKSSNDPSFFGPTIKYHDLNGGIHIFSAGYFKQREFGMNVKLKPNFLYGGESSFRHYTSQTMLIYSSETGEENQESISKYSIVSLRGQLGFGLKHNLGENFTLFEQLDGSIPLVEYNTRGDIDFLYFSDGLSAYLNFKVGVLINLD